MAFFYVWKLTVAAFHDYLTTIRVIWSFFRLKIILGKKKRGNNVYVCACFVCVMKYRVACTNDLFSLQFFVKCLLLRSNREEQCYQITVLFEMFVISDWNILQLLQKCGNYILWSKNLLGVDLISIHPQKWLESTTNNVSD